MSKFSYYVESYCLAQWVKIIYGSRDFCQGWLHARMDSSPRPHFRLVRSDGKILSESEARYDVSIGMIAGWPTAEQYEFAAKEAIEKARVIRENARKHNERAS